MNPHFVEMLRALRDEGVEHLVIGAHALAAHQRKSRQEPWMVLPA